MVWRVQIPSAYTWSPGGVFFRVPCSPSFPYFGLCPRDMLHAFGEPSVGVQPRRSPGQLQEHVRSGRARRGPSTNLVLRRCNPRHSMELVSGALEETFSIATITDFATIYMTFEVMTALSCFVHGKFGQANRTLDVDDEVAYALVRGGTQSYIPDHFRWTLPGLANGRLHFLAAQTTGS